MDNHFPHWSAGDDYVHHHAGISINMQILRKYQLDIIFLFFTNLIFVGIAFFILEQLKADPHDFEWYIAGPFLLLYITYVWEIRSKISIAEKRNITGKTLVYWIALGITLFASFSGPISAKDYWSIDLFFIIFTILLADSYWDFKKMTISCLTKNKKC